MKITPTYTSLIGDIDETREDIPNIDFFREFKSNRRNSRFAKMLPHLIYPNAEWTLYIDANLFLRTDIDELIKLAGEKDMLVFRHAERNCIYDEAEYCQMFGIGGWKNIKTQMRYYKRQDWPTNYGLYCGFLILRKNTPETNRLNERWWAHYCRFSERDQLSMPFIYKGHAKVIDIPNNKDTKYFKRKSHKK